MAIQEQERRIVSSGYTAAAFLIAVGLVVAGWVLGSQIKAIRLADRYITVRGLVERQVKSDLAIWPLTFQVTGNDLNTVTTQADANKATILEFFSANGFAANEVQVGVIDVDDTSTREYGNQKPPYRYIVKQTLTLSTPRVWTRLRRRARRRWSCCRRELCWRMRSAMVRARAGRSTFSTG